MNKYATAVRRLIPVRIALIIAVGLGVGCSATGPRESRASDAAAANVQLGIAYLQQGNLALAKEKLDRALRQNPRSADVHTAMALLYDRLGDDDRVDSHYRSALRLAPRDPEISNNYAVYLCQKGRTEEGVRRFLDAARNPLYRTPEAAYTNAGVCLRSANRLDEAGENFRKALEVRPNFAEAAFQLANLQMLRGRHAEARAQIDTFLASFNATPDLLLLGVRAATATGDRLAAERYARKLRVEFPGSEQTRALAELNRNPG